MSKTSEGATLAKVIAGFSPLLVLALTLGGLLLAITRSSAAFAAVYVVLFVCAVALFISGASLSQNFFPFRRAWPFVLSLFCAFVGWSWQRYVYVSLVPGGFLEYGYFLMPAGSRLRFLLVEAPVAAVAGILIVIMVVAAIAAWRQGARLSVLLLFAWGLVAFIVFGIPAFGLWVVGDAVLDKGYG